MWKNLIFSFLFLSGLSTYAQGNFNVSNDAKATDILKKVSARYKKLPSFSVNISSATTQRGSTKAEMNKGKMELKGTKYRIVLPELEIVSDGKTVWNIDESTKEIQISKVDNSSGLVSPEKLFSNFYEKEFLYKYDGEEKKSGVLSDVIEMTPRDKTNPVFKIMLYVNKSSNTILAAKVFTKSGADTEYTFSGLKMEQSLSDERFVVNPANYSKLEVVDLR